MIAEEVRQVFDLSPVQLKVGRASGPGPQVSLRGGDRGRVSGTGHCTDPGLRPVFFRSDHGDGLTNASEDGGVEEFYEFFPNRASSSAVRGHDR